MDFLTDWITDWLKGVLIDGIMGNLSGLFDNVNTQVGEIAAQVGTTPGDWNPGVFSMIENLSETVVLPIAGLVLTFVATWELIQLIIEKNNLHDLDTWIFFKWVFSATRSYTNTTSQGTKLCGRLDRVVLKIGGFLHVRKQQLVL